MNWYSEVEQRKDELIKDTQSLLQIKSVLNKEEAEFGAPFGKGIKEALEFTLDKCQSFGLKVKNVDGYAGHVEIGQGEEIIGVLCHLDVVPEGDGWTHDPYSAHIENGRIYARGALDDKGPTMAVIYALKIINDLNLKLNKRVRIILGTDEESGWEDLDYYFEREEMPSLGFAPDADFPIIITEKGIVNVSFKGKVETKQDIAEVISLSAGRRPNMVPDSATAIIAGEDNNLNIIKAEFENFLKQYQHGGKVELSDGQLEITLNGVSAHGMEPFKGVNAGLELNRFLLSMEANLSINDWMVWLDKYLYQDHFGSNSGIKFEDEISGRLTMNPGIIKIENGELQLVLNIRYPVTTNYDSMIQQLEGIAKELSLRVDDNNTPPHHVDKEHVLVKTLKKVYEEQTGTEATLLAIGGGTYARALKTGVAFGPLFPGKEETAHQKNEYIEIEDLLRSTAIYAQAIYELAK